MGTNYYFEDSIEKKRHIGKASAAGYYCWECRKTLFKYGEAHIHTTKIDSLNADLFWNESCPQCGLKIQDMKHSMSDDVIPAKIGIQTVSSFSFAMHPIDLFFAMKEYRGCLLYTSPSPRDLSTSRMPSSA